MHRHSEHIDRLRAREHPWRYRPHFLHRLWDAWHCLIGSHSLHLAWQVGHDEGTAEEYHRTVVMRGK